MDIDTVLPLLFEDHPVIQSDLAPALPSDIITPTALVAASIQIIRRWPLSKQSQFIHSHPRIGAPLQNLSSASKEEQTRGGEQASPEVIEKLRVLNAKYEAMFPGLRYITFVNGRSRSIIAQEMEDRLKGWGGLDGHNVVYDEETEQWKTEVKRAVAEVGWIANSRAVKLEAEGS